MSPEGSQDKERVSQEEKEMILAILLLLLQIGDIVTTRMCLNHGHKEGNPLITKMSWKLILLKISMALFILLITMIYNNIIVQILILFDVIIYFFVVSSNTIILIGDVLE